MQVVLNFMAIEDFYLDIVRKRPKHAVNNKGETVKTYTNTNIKGFYNGQPSSSQLFAGGKWATKYSTTLLTNDADIQHDDIVFINSENWRVVGFRANSGNKNHHYEVQIERLDQVD